MNPEFFTEEYRSFKYLKCSPSDLKFYKNTETLLNNIKPEDRVDDITFVWQKRIEFIEQLFDLVGNDVWFVDANGTLRQIGTNQYDYETAGLFEFKECVLYKGSRLTPGKYITINDLPEIENSIENKINTDQLFICSRYYYTNIGIEPDLRICNLLDPMVCHRIFSLPLIPHHLATYNAMFYDKEWAELYQKSVTQFFRKNNYAISAISRLF
jgi:hypothetical protein